MKAVVCHRYGAPQACRVVEVDKPTPRETELLVKVYATTVNRTDCGYLRAAPFILRRWTGALKPNKVLGTEFAGEVQAVGRDVSSFSAGDRIFGYVEGSFGAHAQYLAVPEDGSIALMPSRFTYQQAAPGTEGSHYALSSLLRAGLRPGQSVLVYGATGAIGSAAVQLAKAMDVVVTGVCATPHLELVRRLGADNVVDYTVGDFTQDDQRYDIVFDAVGKSSFGDCAGLLRPGGVYVSSDLGPRGENIALPLVTRLSGRHFDQKHVAFPLPFIDKGMVRRLARLMERGAFEPLIDRAYPLDEIAAAYQFVETGQKVGNVVVVVDHWD